MTFHEWFRKQTKPFTAAEIWKASDSETREECARICEQYAHYHAKECESAKAESWLILQCAAKIRETIK
jgi:hypothetical protein